MGKRGPKPGQPTPVSARVAPVMKYQEACHLADKTSRSIVKISQLLEVTHKSGYEAGDPNKVVEKYIDKLKKRVNRRLQKLAKWSDSSNEDRNAEFRNVPRGVPIGGKLYAYSKPATSFLPPLVQNTTSAGSFAGASSSMHRTGSANTSNGNISMMPTNANNANITTTTKTETVATAENPSQETNKQETSEETAKADSAESVQPTAESTEETKPDQNQEEPEEESKEEEQTIEEQSNAAPQEAAVTEEPPQPQPPSATTESTNSNVTEEIPASETTAMDCE